MAAVTGTSEDYHPGLVEADYEDEEPEVQGLARKLTCTVCSATITGVILILLSQVLLTLSAVPEWGDNTRESMIELEGMHLQRLAEAKSGTIEEHFWRVRESILQLQAFAGQAALLTPETMTVDAYVASFSGLQQAVDTYDHSVW